MFGWEELCPQLKRITFSRHAMSEMNVTSQVRQTWWRDWFVRKLWLDIHESLDRLGPCRICCLFQRDVIRIRFITHMGEFLHCELVVSCHILRTFVPNFDAIFQAERDSPELAQLLVANYGSLFLHSSLDMLTQRLLNLTFMCLNDGSQSTDAYAVRFRECLTGLISLDLEGCFQEPNLEVHLLAGAFFVAVVERPCLYSLSLGSKIILSDHAIKRLCLTQLSLRMQPWNVRIFIDYGVRFMSAVLRYVDLSVGMTVSLQTARWNLRAGYADITAIHFWYMEGLTNADLYIAASLINLQNLSLRACPRLSCAGLNFLSRDTDGRRTTILRLEIINCIGMNDSCLRTLAGWPYLSRLVLVQSAQYTDAGIISLVNGGNSNLDYLAISNCFGLSDRILSIVAHSETGIRDLRHLLLDRSLVNREGMLAVCARLWQMSTFRSVDNQNEYVKDIEEASGSNQG